MADEPRRIVPALDDRILGLQRALSATEMELRECRAQLQAVMRRIESISERYNRSGYVYRLMVALSEGYISAGKGHEALSHYLAGVEDPFAETGNSVWERAEKADARVAKLEAAGAAMRDRIRENYPSDFCDEFTAAWDAAVKPEQPDET